jgi:hypothetical protein
LKSEPIKTARPAIPLLVTTPPRDPETVQEWREQNREYADQPWRWMPGKQGRQLLGLPSHFGKRQRPFDDRWQERFLALLVDDKQFSRAVGNVLRSAN